MTLTFVQAGNNIYNGSVYAYPYYLKVGTGTVELPMMCDDYSDEIGGGESWPALAHELTQTNAQSEFLYSDQSGLNEFGQGSDALGGATDTTTAIEAYEEAGYILTQMTSGGIANWSEGNAAVWYLFTPGALTVDATASQMLYQAYQFVSANPTYNFSNITVLTPVQQGAWPPAGIPGRRNGPGARACRRRSFWLSAAP